MKNNTYNRRKEEGVCVYCGKMPPQSGKLGCADCAEKRKLNHALRKKQRKASKKMTLSETLREIAQYNKAHGTNYSYGYYSALKSRALI
mgnify:CR=1 FL=1